MRHLFILILGFQILSGNFLGGELLKLPFLVRHYRIHQARRPDDTWFDFLRLHYSNLRHRKSDPSHRQLPLYSIAASNLSYLLPPGSPHPEIGPAAVEQRCPHYFADETLLPSDFRARLLRPPRA